MSLIDYLVDALLILIVFRQVRESRLDRRAVALPLVIVAVVGKSYLHNVPSAPRDVALMAALVAVGVAFGLISAMATLVRSDGGRYPLVKAGFVAAATWVLSMGSRMAFAIWASTSGGTQSLGMFSFHHGLSVHVWAPALVLMALGEVITRVGMLWVRGQRVQHARARSAELRSQVYPAA